MGYREDADLQILEECSNEELGILVELLQKEAKASEELSYSPEYRSYYPNHKRYWKRIAQEIQLFGGNSIVNMMRGTGVLYKEICHDVASKLQISNKAEDTVETLELEILLRLFEDAIIKMSEEERLQFIETLHVPAELLSEDIALGVVALRAAVQTGGFASYQLSSVVAGAIGRQLLGHGVVLVSSVAFTRAIGTLAGPIGWVLSGAWVMLDVASPAYRITIPSVVFIASFRQRVIMQKMLKEKENKNAL